MSSLPTRPTTLQWLTVWIRTTFPVGAVTLVSPLKESGELWIARSLNIVITSSMEGLSAGSWAQQLVISLAITGGTLLSITGLLPTQRWVCLHGLTGSTAPPICAHRTVRGVVLTWFYNVYRDRQRISTKIRKLTVENFPQNDTHGVHVTLYGVSFSVEDFGCGPIYLFFVKKNQDL